MSALITAPYRLVVAACLVVCMVMLSILLAQRTDPAYALAKDVGFAPGYEWNVAAAGYWVCGELARGATGDEVTHEAVTNGIGGDLYPSDAVTALVEQAPKRLCPSVAK